MIRPRLTCFKNPENSVFIVTLTLYRLCYVVSLSLKKEKKKKEADEDEDDEKENE